MNSSELVQASMGVVLYMAFMLFLVLYVWMIIRIVLNVKNDVKNIAEDTPPSLQQPVQTWIDFT